MIIEEYKVSLLEIETALDLVDNNKMLSTYYASKPSVSLDLVEVALEFLNNKVETDLEGSDEIEDSNEAENSDGIDIDLSEEEDNIEENDLEADDLEEDEDYIDIDLEDKYGIEEDGIEEDGIEEDGIEEDILENSNEIYSDLEEDDEIDIDLEEEDNEDDLEEDDLEEDDLEEDDLEDSDDIDIDLGEEDDLEDDSYGVDIDLEDDDSEDTVDIELDTEDEFEDSADISLEENDIEDGEDIDIDIEEEDEIDIDLRENALILPNSKKNEVLDDNIENKSKNILERVKEVNTSNSRPIKSEDSKVVYTENKSKNVDPVSNTINVKQLNLNNDKLNVASITGDVNRVNNINQVVSVKKRNYDSLATDKLYNFVALYMKKHGVKDSGVSKALLTEEFGANNIKKLINKSYLIQLYDGTLTFNR